MLAIVCWYIMAAAGVLGLSGKSQLVSGYRAVQYTFDVYYLCVREAAVVIMHYKHDCCKLGCEIAGTLFLCMCGGSHACSQHRHGNGESTASHP